MNHISIERRESGPAHMDKASAIQLISEAATEFAQSQVLGENADLTAETFGEFVACFGEEREHMLTSATSLRGPISNAELFKLVMRDPMKSAGSIFITLDALSELRARYLADDYTKRVIANESDRYMGA
jgi:hypothetical protein